MVILLYSTHKYILKYIINNNSLELLYMSSKPTDQKLYEKVKKQIFKKYPTNSAYRSGLLVQEYKKRGGRYTGNKKDAPLKRWFSEEWRTQDGKKTYQKKGDVFRPTKRINKSTPTTLKELSKKQITKAKKEKKKYGRVKKFDK